MGLPAGSSLPCSLLATAASLLLAGCSPQPAAQAPNADPELTWARQALERNPQLEVLASDAQSGIFTVRHRANGTIDTLSMDQLMAAPLKTAQSAAPALPAPEHVPDYPPEHTPDAETQPIAAQLATVEDVAASAAEETAAIHEQVEEESAAPARHYTIERSAGQVRVSGPGISIVSAQAQGKTPAGAAARGSPDSPIICEGRRLLHLDDRRIVVDGDAIIARGGCELHITNSRIIATGTALVAHDAIVHITNSHVEGATGSFDAGARARLYLRASTLLGVPRRADMAVVQDQGGNRWR